MRNEGTSSWSSGPLYATSILQMALGVSIIVVQAIMNNKVQNVVLIIQVYNKNADLQRGLFNYYAFILGSVIVLVGLICALVTICKPKNPCFLASFSSTLCIVGIAASLCCIGASTYCINQIENATYHELLRLSSPSSNSVREQNDLRMRLTMDIQQVQTELSAIAVLGGVNIMAVIINAALFCRAGGACSHPDV